MVIEVTLLQALLIYLVLFLGIFLWIYIHHLERADWDFKKAWENFIEDMSKPAK